MSRFQRGLLLVVALLVLSASLSACTTGALSIEMRVTLFAEERWEARADIVFAGEQMALLGDQVEQTLQIAVAQWEAQGISASYSRRTLGNGNVQFRLKTSGQGLAQLNAALFDNLAVLHYDATTDPPQITFRCPPIGSFFSLALSRTFSLTGGKVLSSNGLVSGNTVTWTNPFDTMEATLTPAPQFALWPLLLAGGAVVAVTGGVIGARSAGKISCAHCGARIPRRADYCPQCGGMRN